MRLVTSDSTLANTCREPEGENHVVQHGLLLTEHLQLLQISQKTPAAVFKSFQNKTFQLTNIQFSKFVSKRSKKIYNSVNFKLKKHTHFPIAVFFFQLFYFRFFFFGSAILEAQGHRTKRSKKYTSFAVSKSPVGHSNNSQNFNENIYTLYTTFFFFVLLAITVWRIYLKWF